MNVVALVPARAGSKGLPHKNTRLFCGKPLMAWAITVGQRTCDETYVSTDDPEALEIAERYGAKVIMRPVELARDRTPMIDVMQHALGCMDTRPDAVALLQPTQPLRQDEHVTVARSLLTDEWDSVVSVVRIPPHMSPDYACTIRPGNRLIPNSAAVRRQDARAAFYRDGTIYLARPAVIEAGELYGDCCAYEIRPEESCAIDTAEDWTRAESMMERRR